MQRPSNQNKHRSFLNSWKSSTSTARRPAHSQSTATTTAVGAPAPAAAVCSTEVIASQALKKNAQAFQYPSSGFAIKIEYSLLYTMMNHPEIYPATVIQSMIKSEDFTQYMEVNPSASRSKHHDTTLTIQDDTQFSSYAQLSALLALAAEKWPPPSSSSSSDATVSSNTENDIRTNPTATNCSNDAINVVQVLCQLLIQCVIRHAEAHHLDRETEINELFLPFQRVTSDKANRTAVMAVLPAYVGMTASILTGGNPLPFYIGYAVSINAIANQERDLANFKQIANTTSRMSNVETTNLLNDTDYDE
jgi:hypothetical protein